MQKIGSLSRAVLSDGTAACTIIDYAPLLETARKRFRLDIALAGKLGRAMAICAYFSSWLKDEGSFSNLSIAGSEKISVTCDGALRLSGHIERLDAFEGKGYFSLTRFDGGIPDTGSCQMQGEDLGEEFSRYFAASEQRAGYAVLQERFEEGGCEEAIGIFLEALPGADLQTFERIKKSLPLKDELCGSISDAGNYLKERFGAQEITRRNIFFSCRCNRGKASLAVRSLGEGDALQLLKEQGKITVRCPDCGKVYEFFEDDLTELFRKHG